MPTQRLQKLLKQLQEEIEHLEESSSAERQRLETLISDIEVALDQDTEEQHATLLDNVRSKLLEIQTDHPTASGIARRLMQTLSDMGI